MDQSAALGRAAFKRAAGPRLPVTIIFMREINSEARGFCKKLSLTRSGIKLNSWQIDRGNDQDASHPIVLAS